MSDYKPPTIDEKLKPVLKDFTRTSYRTTHGECFATVEPVIENHAYNFVQATLAVENELYLNFVIKVLDSVGYDVTKREEA